mmetsp:Transcript_7285/g.13425  ORF Transcript_7285/g.13425 Transcript_7285/m.13425 type:complete len:225 (-) Transcript_7285:1413-2087(-)
MCVSLVVLSSACLVLRAITCLTAVRNAIGLKRPDIHVDMGLMASAVHVVSCSQRLRRSLNWGPRFFIDGHAFFSQVHLEKGFLPGHSLIVNAVIMSSMGCVMFSWPLSPLSRSTSVRRISLSRLFMRVHSCNEHTTNGACASSSFGVAVSIRSSMMKSGGRRSVRSFMTVRTMLLPPPPPSPPPPDSWRMVTKSVSAPRTRKPISAFGWRPYRTGLSEGVVVLM